MQLPHRLNAAVIAAVLALGGGAVALAASGLLGGSPVAAPGGQPTATVGIGAPSPGAGRLALQAADPEGGLPWGMRVVHTTRDETCVQIGRVQDGQLGQLGIDGAYHDDGRFHPLTANAIPTVGGGYATITCLLPGETMLGYSPTEHRNAEWGIGSKARPTTKQLRSVSWGLLGPHAMSVTYRSGEGLKTIPLTREGAFMIVRPVLVVPPQVSIGGFQSGSTIGHEVSLEPGTMGLTAITYRFGKFVCSVGHVAETGRRCPAPPREPMMSRPHAPTHRLNLPVRARTVTQTPAVCRAEYLLDPCYAAEVEFKAPYAITEAGSEYSVVTRSKCTHAKPGDWGIERDIRRGETVRSRSLGYFNCTEDEFEVQYIDVARARGLLGTGHESAILGVAKLKASP